MEHAPSKFPTACCIGQMAGAKDVATTCSQMQTAGVVFLSIASTHKLSTSVNYVLVAG